MRPEPLAKSESNDNFSKLYGYLQKIAQPFLAQFAAFKPASAVIPLRVDRDIACNAIVKEIQKRSPGVEVCGNAPNSFTLSCKVNAKRKLRSHYSKLTIKLTRNHRHQGRQEELLLRLGDLRNRP